MDLCGNTMSARAGHYRRVKRSEALKAETSVTLWRGEQMDDQLAVEGLLKRDPD